MGSMYFKHIKAVSIKAVAFIWKWRLTVYYEKTNFLYFHFKYSLLYLDEHCINICIKIKFKIRSIFKEGFQISRDKENCRRNLSFENYFPRGLIFVSNIVCNSNTNNFSIIQIGERCGWTVTMSHHGRNF